jgi:hypothetical protein
MMRWLIGLILTTAMLVFLCSIYAIADRYSLNPMTSEKWHTVPGALWIPTWILRELGFLALAVVCTIWGEVVFVQGVLGRPLTRSLWAYAAALIVSAVACVGSVALFLATPSLLNWSLIAVTEDDVVRKYSIIGIPSDYRMDVRFTAGDLIGVAVLEVVLALPLFYALLVQWLERRDKACTQRAKPHDAASREEMVFEEM